MKISFVGYTCIVLISISLISCSGKPEADTPEKWLGTYTYKEPAGNDNITRSWELSVNKLNDEYFSILNVSSPGGSSSYSNKVSVSKNELFIIYEKSFSKPDPAFQKGDTLFSLVKESAGITTKWKRIVPASSVNNPGECSCFIFHGVNETNNTISLP